MSEKKVGPTDFAAEIERLKAAGKLPSLEQVLDAVADARRKFGPKLMNSFDSFYSDPDERPQ
jgi:hypothetical protein